MRGIQHETENFQSRVYFEHFNFLQSFYHCHSYTSSFVIFLNTISQAKSRGPKGESSVGCWNGAPLACCSSSLLHHLGDLGSKVNVLFFSFLDCFF